MQCLVDNIKAENVKLKEAKKKAIGPKGIEEATAVYDRYKEQYIREGSNPAEAADRAVETVLSQMQEKTDARARMAQKKVAVVADVVERMQQAEVKAGFGKRVGRKIARGAKSFLEDHEAIVGPNVTTEYATYKGRYQSFFENVLDSFSKGAFGRQIGKAHFPNIIRELDGINTHDPAAKQIADAYRRVKDVALDDFNHVGGAIRKPKGLNILPDTLGSTQAAMAPIQDFVADYMNWIDWNSQTWPEGRLIEPGEREDFLKNVKLFRASDGNNEYTPGKGGGQGAAIGDMLDMNQMLVFKDAVSWEAANKKYGDKNSTIFDVMVRDLDRMAWKVAMIKVLGPNPEAMIDVIKGLALKHASDVQAEGKTVNAARAVDDTKAVLNQTFDNMARNILRNNPIDPNSRIATVSGVTTNLASAAMLAKAIFTAVPSDLATTMITRWANHQPVLRFMGHYLANLVQYRRSQEFLIQSAIATDEIISSGFSATRFGPFETYGYEWSKRVSDTAMRANFMSRHTNALRAANQKEMMGSLHRLRDKSFNSLATREMFERAGITEREWDIVRHETETYRPRGDGSAGFLKPMDIYKLKHEDAPEIAQKFQAMLYNEGRRMVIATSLEAGVWMKGGTRPDTARGAFQHSASMFGGYPLTYLMVYSRMFAGMDSKMRKGQLITALMFTGLMAGAISQQLRNLIAGKEFADMKDGNFWMKSALTGGVFSIASDYVGAAIQNDTGNRISSQMAGPLANAWGSAIDAGLASPLQWLGLTERTGELTAGEYGSQILSLAQRYVLPQTFWLQPIIERDFINLFNETIDPAGARTRNRNRIKRAKETGTPYRRGFEPDQGIFTQ